MAYTQAMRYARLAGMLEVAQKAVTRCREAAGALPNTDDIRATLDEMRDQLHRADEHALFLGMEEARKTVE